MRPDLSAVLQREEIVLDGPTPDAIVRLALTETDLAYRMRGTKNGCVKMLAVQVDWIMQQWALAEKRRSLLATAVAICTTDESLTDLATLKRTWLYAQTGRDEPVGSRTWRDLEAMIREHDALQSPPSASPALAQEDVRR